MALRDGRTAGRIMGGGSLDGVQRSDQRMTQAQLARDTRHYQRYPLRITAPAPIVTSMSPAFGSMVGGYVVTITGDFFDMSGTPFVSPQGTFSNPTSQTNTEQVITCTWGACPWFGQMDLYVYNHEINNAGSASRVFRYQPFEQVGAQLFYRAYRYSVSGGTGTWQSSERGGPLANYYPATASSSVPTANSSGCPVFTSSTNPLTQADLMANWLGIGDFHMIAVVDLAALTSTVHLHGLESILSDSLGQIQLGFYINSGTWTVSVGAFGGALGYEAKTALPSNTAQRVVVQAKKVSGLLSIRLNGGAWVTGNTIPGSGTLDTGGSLVIGKGFNSLTHFQGTIWALGVYNAAQLDATFSDLINAWAGVAFPTSVVKLLDLDSRHVTTKVGDATKIASMLDQSGNGYDATAPIGNEPTNNTSNSDYGGIASVDFPPVAIKYLDQTSSIVSALPAQYTMLLVGHVSTYTNASNAYFVMTTGGNTVGFFSQQLQSWSPYSGQDAPLVRKTNPAIRSIVVSTFTGGDTQRFYQNSKFSRGFAGIYGGEVPLTELRMGSNVVTTGFRIGQWQTPDTPYSPSGPICRVIIYQGILTQDQIESELATMGALYNIDIVGDNTIGITGKWNAGNYETAWVDYSGTTNGRWRGVDTTGPTFGQDMITNGGSIPSSHNINGLAGPETNGTTDSMLLFPTNYSYTVQQAVSDWFAADGSAGAIIVAMKPLTAQADPGAGNRYTGPQCISDTGTSFGLVFTASGFTGWIYDGGFKETTVAAANATNHIALMKWSGGFLSVAVNAVAGVITWSTPVAVGNLATLGGYLFMGRNWITTALLNADWGAVRLYNRALTDAEFNAAGVEIQNLLAWSNGFSSNTAYTQSISESIAIPTAAWTKQGVYARSMTENIGLPSMVNTRATVLARALAESMGAPTDANTRALVEARSMAENIAIPTMVNTRTVTQARAQAESIAIPTDANTRIATLARSQAESIAAPTDANTRLRTAVRALAESISAPTDVNTRSMVLARAEAESIAAPTDANTRIAAKVRAVAESVAAPTDANTRAITTARALAESITAPTDVNTRSQGLARTLAESITAPTDADTRALVQARTQSENIAAPTDADTRSTVLARTETESVAKPTDAITRVTAVARAASESISAPTDANTRLVPVSRSQSENIAAPTDANSRILSAVRALAESISAPTDANTRAVVEARNIAETVAAPTDANTRALTESRQQSESVTKPTDANTRVATVARAQPENVAIPTEANTRSLTLSRSKAESISAPTDVNTRAAGFGRSAAESISAPTEANSRVFVGARNLPENIVIPFDVVTFVKSGGGVFNRSMAESLGAPTETNSRVTTVSRAQLETIAACTDANTRATSLGRANSESIAAPLDVNTRLVGFARGIAESVAQPSDANTRTTAISRSNAESISAPTDSSARSMAFLRSMVEAVLKPSDTNVRLTVLGRSVAESLLAPTDTNSHSITTSRSISESILKPTDANSRSLQFTRAQIETVTAPTDTISRTIHVARTVPESLTSPTDAWTHAIDALRIVTENIPSPTDVNSYNRGYSLFVTESVEAPTDLATFSLALFRTQTESIPAPTDAPSTSQALQRLIAEAVGAPFDVLLFVYTPGLPPPPTPPDPPFVPLPVVHGLLTPHILGSRVTRPQVDVLLTSRGAAVRQKISVVSVSITRPDQIPEPTVTASPQVLKGPSSPGAKKKGP